MLCGIYKIRRFKYHFPWDQLFPTLVLCYLSEFLITSRWYNIENASWENLVCGNFKYKCMPYGSLSVSFCLCVCLACSFFFSEKDCWSIHEKKLIAFIVLHLEKCRTCILFLRGKNGPMKYNQTQTQNIFLAFSATRTI